MSETKKQVTVSIHPAKKVVVVRRTELSSAPGLVLVESKAPQIGEIITFGEGKKPVAFNVGDLIAYREFGEYEYFLNGETLYFVKFADILGVLKKKKGCCD